MRSAVTPLILLAASLAAAPALAATPGWMSVNKSAKTVELDVDMGVPTAKNVFNFNGYSKGAMTVTVPVGWTVKVKAKDEGALAHSVEIVPKQSQPPQQAVTPAFKGAETPNPTKGVQSKHSQAFSFKADKPGEYWMMCGVPGHAMGGMWDVLKVSASASAPSVSTSG